jgi:hypothetical protein
MRPVWYESDLLDAHFIKKNCDTTNPIHSSGFVPSPKVDPCGPHTLQKEWLQYNDLYLIGKHATCGSTISFIDLLTLLDGDESRAIRLLSVGELYGVLLPVDPMMYCRY